MIYILGAGGLAREVLAAYRALGREAEVAGFVEEPRRADRAAVAGLPVLDQAALLRAGRGALLIGAIGSPLRRRWITELAAAGFAFDTVRHPAAVLDATVRLEGGAVVLSGVHATADVRVGPHTVVYPGCVLTHDVQLGSFVTLAPGVVVGGRVQVGDGAWLGIGATLRNGVRIGPGAMIGAGSVVLEDVPADTLCYGNPARNVRRIGPEEWPALIDSSGGAGPGRP